MENDISKCTGEGCKLKNRCYRFTVKPDFMQSYFGKPPIHKKLCMYFIDDKLFRGLKERGKLRDDIQECLDKPYKKRHKCVQLLTTVSRKGKHGK